MTNTNTKGRLCLEKRYNFFTDIGLLLIIKIYIIKLKLFEKLVVSRFYF